jgi:hypothetical protein
MKEWTLTSLNKARSKKVSVNHMEYRIFDLVGSRFGIGIAGTGRAGMVAKEEVEVRNRFMSHFQTPNRAETHQNGQGNRKRSGKQRCPGYNSTWGSLARNRI